MMLCYTFCQENTVSYQKKKLLLFKALQKMHKWPPISISRQNSSCQGLRFLSEFKLFGKGPSRLHATSATLFENVLLLFPQARCMYFLGQFEKCLLTWTKADRLRKNNKEVFRKRQKILNTHYTCPRDIHFSFLHESFFVRCL